MKEKRYKLIDSYSMKCRLYPNEKQKALIDTMLYGKAAAYNMILYSLKQGEFAKEKKDKKSDGVVHSPLFGKAVEKDVLNALRKENKYVGYAPGSSLSSSKQGVIADIKRAWDKTGNHPIEQWDWKKNLPDGRVQHFGPRFHSKYENHKSLAWQIKCKHIIVTNNRKTLRLRYETKTAPKDGEYEEVLDVKFRGWNQSLRFDKDLQMDFVDWVIANQENKYQFFVRIERDLDRYYIIFTLSNVYRPYTVNTERNNHVGVDVGEITLAALSDGTQYPNIFDHNPKFQRTLDAIDYLNGVKSRRWGYSNQEFQTERKKKRKSSKEQQINIETENRKEEDIQPSKRYMKTQKRIHRLYSRRNDIMNNYYNTVTAEMISNNAKINAETLAVKEMFWWKEKQKDEKTKKGQDEAANSDS